MAIVRLLRYREDVTKLIEYKDIKGAHLLSRDLFLKCIDDFLVRRLKLHDGLSLTTSYNEKNELVVDINLTHGHGGEEPVDYE
jgi:hypothetical protein